jgi:hypothetical protein
MHPIEKRTQGMDLHTPLEVRMPSPLLEVDEEELASYVR